MKEIKKEDLNIISGGNLSVSGPVINAVVNVIKVLKDAGYQLGSGIRRIRENNLCRID